MKTIWKYPVKGYGSIKIDMPRGAQVLSLQLQHGNSVIWALVEPSNKQKARTFKFYQTGELIEDELVAFIGTVQFGEESYVLHLWEISSSAEAIMDRMERELSIS